MYSRCVVLILVALGPWVAAQEQPSTQEPKPYIDPWRAFTIVMPKSWRQMTPDDARAARANTPADLRLERGLIPGRIDRFADVGRWLKNDFDGRCLTIVREDDGEPDMTAETLQRIRDLAKKRSAAGDLRFVIDDPSYPRLMEIGPAKHPAIECALEIRDRDGKPIGKALEFVVPTGGTTIRFSFRAAPGDFPAAEAEFRAAVATLKAAIPPEGRKELSDKLQTPLIIGGLVGLVLLLLYKLSRS